MEIYFICMLKMKEYLEYIFSVNILSMNLLLKILNMVFIFVRFVNNVLE